MRATEMKKQRSTSDMRQFGQARLPSSFFVPTSSASDEKDHNPRPPQKRPISLSEFLNRKVKAKTIGTSTKEKAITFPSAAGNANHFEGSKRGEASSCVLDEAVFRRFSVPPRKEGGVGSSVPEESEGLLSFESTEEVLCTGKRKNPFEVPSGYYCKRYTAPRSLLVLGDDPKPKPGRHQNKILEKRNKTLYDHYANGSGLWDCDREGVDSEEVGCSEIWEGMGSTTLGGLEWH